MENFKPFEDQLVEIRTLRATFRAVLISALPNCLWIMDPVTRDSDVVLKTEFVSLTLVG